MEGVFERLSKDSRLLTDTEYIENTNNRQAAVLVILYTHNNTIRVVLTKRAAHLRNHPGEIALPGGRVDPQTDRTVADTAFREACEEIGVCKEQCRWMGRLEPVRSRGSNFMVHPIVVAVDRIPRRFSFDRNEVELVFTVPLVKFLETKCHQVYDMEDGEDLHVIRHGSHRVMGMTSAVLIQTAMIVYDRSPDFAFQYPTWRVEIE